MARGAPANGAIRPPASRRCSPGQGGRRAAGSVVPRWEGAD